MASTRARLTASYALVLLSTMVAFAVALYFARRAAANQQLGQQAGAVAEDVLATIRSGQSSGRRLTYFETQAGGRVVRATQELGELLDPHPGLFLVLDIDDKLLYSSTALRLVGADDQQVLFDVALRLRLPGEAAIVGLTHDSVSTSKFLLIARREPAAGAAIARVVAALPTDTADLAPQLLIGTLLAMMPIGLLVALLLAYLIAGRAFQPVQQLINEVEAITDGRSLHRRLPADTSNDELSSLTTTLNAMLARLETSFGGLRRFTADASHELKTPLTVLRADVERAMHPATQQTDRLVALEEALQETARMSDLVDSLLTLARADEGRFDLHRALVEVEPLVRDVLETATILGEAAGLTIALSPLDNARLLADEGRLRQLFLNLITNAIKYTPRGGRVDLSVIRHSGDEITFSVRDTGIGIAANDLPYVFERFWRADRVRSRAAERGGFGLGLSIAQWIAQAHGGTLAVQSRLGRGSIFTVTLPLATAPAVTKDEPPSADAVVSAHPPAAGASADRDFTNS